MGTLVKNYTSLFDFDQTLRFAFQTRTTTAIKAGLTFALISWATSLARFSIDTAATKGRAAVQSIKPSPKSIQVFVCVDFILKLSTLFLRRFMVQRL